MTPISSDCASVSRATRPPDGADAVIYDFDFPPASLQKALLSVLLAGPLVAPSAVHVFDVTPISCLLNPSMG